MSFEKSSQVSKGRRVLEGLRLSSLASPVCKLTLISPTFKELVFYNHDSLQSYFPPPLHSQISPKLSMYYFYFLISNLFLNLLFENNFKLSEELQEHYKEFPYTLHLDVPEVNILPQSLYFCMWMCMCAHIRLYMEVCFFLNPLNLVFFINTLNTSLCIF